MKTRVWSVVLLTLFTTSSLLGGAAPRALSGRSGDAIALQKAKGDGSASQKEQGKGEKNDADKPLLPLRKGRWVDLATTVTPGEADGGKWLIRGKAVAVDAREEPTMVWMNFPVRPTGSYEFSVGIMAEDEKANMVIELPLGKRKLRMNMTESAMTVGNARAGVFQFKPRRTYMVTMNVDMKKQKMVIHIDEWIWNFDLGGRGDEASEDFRVRAGATGCRAVFQSMRIKSNE